MPGKKNWLDLFYDWMIRKGKKRKKREIPSEPMAPIGAKSTLASIRRILIDLNYIHAKHIKCNQYKYSVWPHKECKRIFDIRPEEIIDWVDNKFPHCKDRKERQRKSSYVFAAWKFGEYLVFEMKDSNGKSIWKKEQLVQLKEKAYPPEIDEFEIEILPLPIIDGFINYLKTQNLKYYTMTYLSRWLGGMRYQEVINAKTDFRSGTLIINFDTKKVTIWGKGKGGLQKPRHPTLSPHVKKVLKEYLEYREKEIAKKSFKDDPGYLFLNQSGNRYSENSGHLNKILRRYAKAWGKIKKEDMKLVSTHKLGRHGFGTYFYPLTPEKLLKLEMGLNDSKTLERYANIAREQRAYIMNEAANKNNHVEQPIEENAEQEDGSFMEFIKKIRASKNLSREEKAKVIAELI